MGVIDTGVCGFDVEVMAQKVVINDAVIIKRPKAIPVEEWEGLWERMDKNYGENLHIEDGCVVIDFDKL